MDTVKTLVFGGGEIHDWQGIQPKLVAALEASDAFELATAQEDLDALLDLDAYDVLVFHYTVGTISDAQRDALSSWLIGGKGYVGIHSAADSFRDDPAYRRKLEQGQQRRAKQQESYVEDFAGAVRDFLAFPFEHRELAEKLVQRVTAHATPVGSGTVARTSRIPIERRADSAVIAWLRHQTTAYDDMRIVRVKGRRREVRRMLAQRSRELLDRYRTGHTPPPVDCALQRALRDLALEGVGALQHIATAGCCEKFESCEDEL